MLLSQTCLARAAAPCCWPRAGGALHPRNHRDAVPQLQGEPHVSDTGQEGNYIAVNDHAALQREVIKHLKARDLH